jgi:Zn-dependent protease
MFRSLKLGRLFGIPLYIHPTFWLLPLFVLYSHRGAGAVTALFLFAWVLTIFACVVLHELGHALMARRFGIPTHDVTLYPIGGVARLERMSEKPIEEVAIALAGPAVNLGFVVLLAPIAFLAALSGAMNPGLSFDLGESPLALAARFTTMVWMSNLVLLVFNLLPCFPMDGGRVLRALLAMGLGQLKATEIASTVGLCLAVVLAGLAVLAGNPLSVLLAAFVGFAGQRELYGLRQREARRRAAQRQASLPVLEAIPVEPVEQPAAWAQPWGSPGPVPGAGFTGYAWDSEYQVWVKWQDGRPVAAYW